MRRTAPALRAGHLFLVQVVREPEFDSAGLVQDAELVRGELQIEALAAQPVPLRGLDGTRERLYKIE